MQRCLPAVKLNVMTKRATRLFNHFQPKHYDLKLNLDNQELKFDGRVTIIGKKTGRPSRRLTFHQKDLQIHSATITRHDKQGDQIIQVERINRHASFYEVRLHTTQNLLPGEYTVELGFGGDITQNMQGIYPCEFKHGGVSKRLIATQFESHHAREAFPCIDEPEAKATFQLELETEAGLTVLSNTPIESQSDKQNRQVIRFEPTPRMSTYLLAFVYGEMHSVEATTKQGTLVRSWSTVAQAKSHLQYSVDEAVRCLEFFSEYFSTPYPLPKCDQVALPDFDAGAMENWGLITYREMALLADPGNRSVSSEQYISLVVAHELSHQWFGNLVTMKWWDDLWLNESFASLMEHIALDRIHPDWQQWENYTASDVISTTTRDVYKDIQPVGVDVTDPDLIETLFDPGIVYAKGGRLLKMLRDYIGDEAFTKGLRAYFKKHAYGNAERQDLWSALSAASSHDLVGLMSAWISQPGMPLLEVDQQGSSLDISQARFLLDGEPDGTVWPVPLLASQKVTPELIDQASTRVTAPDKQYVVLNHQASGHFFTLYKQADHRHFLQQLLQNRELTAASRINLLNDAFMLARKGLYSLTDCLDMIKSSQSEDRDAVWSFISRIIGSAAHLTEGDKQAEGRLHQLRLYLAASQYDKLGWDDEPQDDLNTKQLRHTIVAYMLMGEHQPAIDEAKQRYQAVAAVADIQAELRSTILSAVVRHGDSAVINRLMEAYPEATADVQFDITGALASTRDPKLAAAILQRALGGDGFVRNQDIMRWLVGFLRNYHTRQVAWDYIVGNWSWIENSIGESKSFDYLPIYCAGSFNTSQWQNRFHRFFGPKADDKRLQRNIAVGSADIQARVDWRERDGAMIKDWLTRELKA